MFDRLFTQAEIAKFTPRELREYEDSRKAYRDLKNSLDTAMREGLEKGRTEGERSKSIEIAKKMKAMRLDDATIMQATGLSASDIADLLNK